MGELAFFFGMRHLGKPPIDLDSPSNRTRFPSRLTSAADPGIHSTSFVKLTYLGAARLPVSARCHKLTGAICLRLPRDRFIPLLKMFPSEEEKIAEAALNTFEQARSSHAGRFAL